MLIGEYTHALDAKKRLSIPAKFRKELGKNMVITRGLDKCLFVYPLDEWKRVSRKFAELSMGARDRRSFSRFMLAGAVEAELDGLGRILIPDFLKDFANLQAKVVLAGVEQRVEIWNEDVWQEYKRKIEQDADGLAEKLGEIGVI
jgi:MraZ protein